VSPAAAVVVAALSFHLDTGEYSNAVYHVLCLAQHAACTREKYDRLWKDELRWSAEDQEQLDRWRSIVRAAETREPAPPNAPLLGNYPSFYPSLRQRTAILSAALDAGSSNAFQRRAARLVSPDDARALAGVLRHFQTRLAPWWRGVGRSRISRIGAIDRQFSAPVRNLFSHVASFLGAGTLSDVYVHVVPSPDVANDEATGTLVGNHFFLELVPSGSGSAAADEAATMIAGVAIHELTHALYDSAPASTHLAVMRQFVASPERAAPAMYTLLNEAIATAVTAIATELARGKMPEEGGEYRHPFIPRLGQAATEPLKKQLAAGGTITKGFVDDYIRQARTILGDDADSLGFRFSATAFIASDPLRAAAASLRQLLAPTVTTDSRRNWERMDELNAAFLVTFDDIREFANRIPDLPALTKRRGFALLLRHSNKSYLLVVAGRDAAAASAVVEQLQPLHPVAKDGVVIIID